MIDTISNTINFSSIWQYVGPLLGVGFGYLISYKVWNHQRQWELRRDAVFDSVRALADLDNAIVSLSRKKNDEAAEFLFQCNSSYLRAMKMADLVVGGKLSKELSEYHACANDLFQIHFMTPEIRERLIASEKGVILSAREVLGIKDAGDLYSIDDSN
jgi:hypothetical protein